MYLGLAAIILAFTSFKTYKKYFSTRAVEQEAQAAAAAAAAEQEEQAENEDADNDNEAQQEQEQPIVDDPEQPAKPAAPEYKNQDTLATSGSDTGSSKEATADVHVDRLSPSQVTTLHATDDDDDDDDQDNTTTANNNKSTLIHYLEQDSRQYPTEKLAALGILWVGLILLTFFKGGKGVDSIIGITCADTAWYAVLIAIQFLWTLGFALYYGLKLVRHQNEKVAVDYPFLPHDVLWDYSKLRFYAFFTFLAGVVAGLIGIGGGMVLGPLMLVMGIHPRVSAATTATMIVLTSSSVAVLFVTAGLVPWEYAVFFFVTCLTGAYVGKKYIDGYVKKTGKASLLIFLLATIIALATIGCVIIVITRLAKADWCLAGFNKFCNGGDSEDDFCAANRFLGFVPSVPGPVSSLR